LNTKKISFDIKDLAVISFILLLSMSAMLTTLPASSAQTYNNIFEPLAYLVVTPHLQALIKLLMYFSGLAIHHHNKLTPHT
jgi:hypothetical protein